MDESDIYLSVDVGDADHDSQSEADISEDEELSEYDETDNERWQFLYRQRQTNKMEENTNCSKG